jgi:hypothetical protein
MNLAEINATMPSEAVEFNGRFYGGLNKRERMALDITCALLASPLSRSVEEHCRAQNANIWPQLVTTAILMTESLLKGVSFVEEYGDERDDKKTSNKN